jgi:hypothetical protein
MKCLKYFIGCIYAFAMTTGLAFAAGPTANVSWSAPVTYVDGSAMPATDIAFYTVKWGSNSKQVTTLSTTADVICGSASFTVSITTKTTAKYPNATSSDAGPVSYATGVTCAPNPPTGLQVS